MVGYGTEGVECGPAEDGVILVGYLNNVKVTTSVREVKSSLNVTARSIWPKAVTGLPLKPIRGMPGGDRRSQGIIIMSKASTNRRSAKLPPSMRMHLTSKYAMLAEMTKGSWCGKYTPRASSGPKEIGISA